MYKVWIETKLDGRIEQRFVDYFEALDLVKDIRSAIGKAIIITINGNSIYANKITRYSGVINC
jgi:chitinase